MSIRLKIVSFASLVALAVLVSGALASVTGPAVAAPQLLPGDASRGAETYQAKCGACHSMDANRVGPKHRGVFGRKSASVSDFHYSIALRKLGVIWNAQTLDRWLQNPTAMAPGTAMGFQLRDAGERADVIAYLKLHSP